MNTAMIQLNVYWMPMQAVYNRYSEDLFVHSTGKNCYIIIL